MIKPKFCPFCGKQTIEQSGSAFVEAGEYDGRRYEAEGDADGYHCTSCGEGFVDFAVPTKIPAPTSIPGKQQNDAHGVESPRPAGPML